MKKINKVTFFLVISVLLLLISIAVCGFEMGSLSLKSAGDIRFGIDIRGGVEAVFKPKLEEGAPQPTSQDLENAKLIIETRMDNKNILDREIMIDDINKEIFVRFPWKSGDDTSNAQQAIAELGNTALLTFTAVVAEEGKTPAEETRLLTGADVATTYVQNNSTGIGYCVALEFTSEGAEKFAQATRDHLNQPLYIYMDEIPISAPVVESVITGGHAQITGDFTYDQARELSDTINAGSLPFALESSNYSIISPTLGSNALEVMLDAGIIAFIIVAAYMLIFYRLPGFVACIGLITQLVIQILAVSVPQITLTLPGMAGIILSLGMGIDTNIIISERIKEELRSGKSLTAAITIGYRRAFSAVLDGNVTTIIVAVILMIFGSGSMLSFGYTLLTGVIINFISGIIASRLMTTSLSMYKPFQATVLYGNRRAAK